MPLKVQSSAQTVLIWYKAPWTIAYWTPGPTCKCSSQCIQSFFSCKLSVQKKEGISLVLFRVQGLWRLKFGKLFWRLPSAWMVTVLPGWTPPASIRQVSPRSFKEQGNQTLPFSARSGLRQLRAPANSKAESGMQISTLGTVHKVLSKTYRPLRDRRQFGERKFLTCCCILLFFFFRAHTIHYNYRSESLVIQLFKRSFRISPALFPSF